MNDDQIKNLLKEVSIPQELSSQLRAIMSSTDKVDRSAADTCRSVFGDDYVSTADHEIPNRLPGRPFWLQPPVLIGLGTAAAILIALFVWLPRSEINSIAGNPDTNASLSDQQELELLQARIDAIRAELLEAEVRELENQRDKLARLRAKQQLERYEKTLLTTALSNQTVESLGGSQQYLENELLTNVIEQFHKSSEMMVTQKITD